MKKRIRALIPYIITIVLAILVRTYVFAFVNVDGSSMYPSLKNGDVLYLDKISYRFNKVKRGDVVVINMGKDKYIKRVIGLPGDVIFARNNQVYINKKPLEEKYLPKETITQDFDLELITNKYQIPDNEFFVMGDNRVNSKDSRVFGTIEKKQIIGKTRAIVFPINRTGKNYN